jgi:dTDP-4-dehydrorhamnose 3,5-epimerase
MNVDIHNASIPGCFELVPKVFEDERGYFTKIFHQEVFQKHGLDTHYTEEYFSRSKQDVIRGMHFQLPPEECVKIVYCIDGEVMDVVLDLRVGSPTYGKYEIFNLNDRLANILYIPIGLAHGFYTKSKTATMMYKVSKSYSPACDAGIHWNSAEIPWPTKTPIMSKRDSEFISLDNFQSPFIYN